MFHSVYSSASDAGVLTTCPSDIPGNPFNNLQMPRALNVLSASVHGILTASSGHIRAVIITSSVSVALYQSLIPPTVATMFSLYKLKEKGNFALATGNLAPARTVSGSEGDVAVSTSVSEKSGRSVFFSIYTKPTTIGLRDSEFFDKIEETPG